jgi:lamin tail-like protein
MRNTRLTLGSLLLVSAAIVAGCNASDSTAVPLVTTIDLVLARDTIEIGEANTSQAVAIDQFGDTILASPTFSSSVPTVAGINPFTGNMIALSAGTTEITATFGLKSAKKVVTVLAPAIRVNEVKPNGEGPGGWVELFNPTDAPVNIAGWVITASNHTAAFTFPAGAVIAARGFLTVEEADFPQGLRSVDEVHLFNPFRAQADAFAWPVNPVTSFGRCPEGTGPFITNTAPSKTRANQCPVAAIQF